MKTGKCSSMLDWAFLYAERSCPVFPCSPHGKRPLTPHGFKDATTDPTQIRRWWKQWPDANIGIPTGKASGLLALDVDPRNGGFESLEALYALRKRPKPLCRLPVVAGCTFSSKIPAA